MKYRHYPETLSVHERFARLVLAAKHNPTLVSRASERVFRLSQRFTGHTGASLSYLADALHEHRHVVNYNRIGHQVEMMRHAVRRDDYLNRGERFAQT
jgi:hypothetical protein